MRLYTKGTIIRVANYENSRYIYTLCGSSLVTFRIYKTLRNGDSNLLYDATNSGLVESESYIFEFSR